MIKRFLGALITVLIAASPAGAQYITTSPSGGSSSISSGTTPISGGGDTQVCFNDAATIACGDAGLTYNKTTNVLTITGGQLSLAGGTVTSSTPLISATQTWNSGGTTFNALLVNVTNTASAAASTFFDFQIGGSSRFKLAADMSGITVGGSWNDFIFTVPSGGGSRAFSIKDGSTIGLTVAADAIAVTGSLSFGASVASPDIYLKRDAAATLALRDGTTAQTFNVYNTFTDASNYERVALVWATNVFKIRADAAGSGSNRSISIVSNSNTDLGAGGTESIVRISSAVGISFPTDNFYDIGASGATRPRHYFGGGNLTVGGQITAGADELIGFTGRSWLGSASSGVIRMLDSGLSGFGSLLLGPSGTTYNRIKHDAAGILAIKLADDSAYSGLRTSTWQSTVVAVGSLGTCNAGAKGTRHFVSDANATTFATTVAGGGANNVPVVCDGTNWIIGSLDYELEIELPKFANDNQPLSERKVV